jgi:hypothetical protein
VNGLRVVTRTALLFLLALALHGLLSERHVSTGSAPSRVIHVRYDAPADGIEQYRYVPIDVPPATDTLEVSCRYDDGGGETVVQLGLFEPGPLELGGSNFRGYGGNHREPIVIGQTRASLGYRAGPLPSGQWHLLVGLHKVPFDGVALDIDVTTRAGPLPNPGRWYAGGLHLHTVHSDGALTTADLLSRASRAGARFRRGSPGFTPVTLTSALRPSMKKQSRLSHTIALAVSACSFPKLPMPTTPSRTGLRPAEGSDEPPDARAL